jgi:hypothetical protein
LLVEHGHDVVDAEGTVGELAQSLDLAPHVIPRAEHRGDAA